MTCEDHVDGTDQKRERTILGRMVGVAGAVIIPMGVLTVVVGQFGTNIWSAMLFVVMSVGLYSVFCHGLEFLEARSTEVINE